MRNKITANIEAVHDKATGGPALKISTNHLVSKKQTTEVISQENTHDDDFEFGGVGFPTIWASNTLTSPSTAYPPGGATSLA